MHAEMDMDHVEHLGVDACMADGDDADGLEPEATMAMPAGGSKRDHIVCLWPFAFSKEYYKSIVHGLCGCERLSHIVVPSTSAHPACALAAHDLLLPAHIHYDRVSQHSRAHGQLVLRNFLRQEFQGTELARAGREAPRARADDLTFLQVAAPAVHDQTLCFQEVLVDETSAWRGGFDQFPAVDALDMGVQALLQQELVTNGLALRHPGDGDGAGGRLALMTEKARGEGDILCPVSCLLFSSAAGVLECLHTAGKAALLDGPLIRVTGLRCPGGSEVMDAYGIPVGAARLASHYGDAGRSHANARIQVRPGRGANDGFLEFTVRTHNGHGIAAGREIVLDFGPARARGLEPRSKRFKGALDTLLEKQFTTASALAATGGAAPAAAPGPALVAVSPDTLVAAPAAASAAQVATPAAPVAVATPMAAPAIAPLGAAGATILAQEANFRVELRADGGITTRASKDAVARILPKTILHVFSGAEMGDALPDTADALKFVFRRSNTQARPAAWGVGPGGGRHAGDRGRARGEGRGRGESMTSRQVMVMKQGTAVGRMVTLAELISSSNAESLWQHNKFPAAGVPPSTLTVKKVQAFLPDGKLGDAFPRLVQHLQHAGKLSLLWAVVVKSDSRITPYGLALVATKQIMAKREGTNVANV